MVGTQPNWNKNWDETGPKRGPKSGPETGSLLTSQPILEFPSLPVTEVRTPNIFGSPKCLKTGPQTGPKTWLEIRLNLSPIRLRTHHPFSAGKEGMNHCIAVARCCEKRPFYKV